MRQAVRFVAALLAGLGLLAWAAYGLLTRTTRGWFEADVELRAQLAVTSARQSLVSYWNGDRQVLAEVLADITRDKRIMGAAACTDTGELLAATEAYPMDFSCSSILSRLQQERPRASSAPWSMMADSRSATPRDNPHLLAYPVAQSRTLRDLPLEKRAARRAPRLEHFGLRRITHRSRSQCDRAALTPHLNPALSELDR